MAEQLEAKGEAAPLPPRHWLFAWGLGILLLGGCALAYAALGFDIQTPPVPTTALERVIMERQIEEAATSFKEQAFAFWAGEHLLVAGFFMWLAGAAIDALRHPKAY